MGFAEIFTNEGHNPTGEGSFSLAELEEDIPGDGKALGWKQEACLGGWGLVPRGRKVRSLARGGKVLLGMCAGTLLAEEEVRGPSIGLSLKAGVGRPSQDYCGVRQVSEKGAPFPPSSGLLERGGLLPGLGHSQHPVPPPRSRVGGRQAGRQAGGFSRGLCRVGGFPRARSEARLTWRQLPQIQTWSAG